MDQSKNTSRLLAFFERQNEDGTYVYEDEAVRHFLPLLAMQIAMEWGPQAWTPPIQRLMDEFVGGLGLPEGFDGTQLNEAVDAYYAKAGVDPALKRNFQELVRELFAEGSPQELSEAAAKLLGMEPQTLQSPTTVHPPKGRVGVSVAGLLFQHTAAQKRPEDDTATHSSQPKKNQEGE